MQVPLFCKTVACQIYTRHKLSQALLLVWVRIYNWLPVFLKKKAQAVSNYRYESKILSSLPVLFLLLTFCYLVMFQSLVFALYIVCWFNIFLFFVLYGALRLLLESKTRGERKSINTDGSSVWKVDVWRFVVKLQLQWSMLEPNMMQN